MSTDDLQNDELQNEAEAEAGNAPAATDEVSPGDGNASGAKTLSREECDTIGEITNIAMGAAASTLSAVLGQDTDLSMPDVEEHASLDSLDEPMPGEDKIFIGVSYSGGLDLSTGFVMRTADAAHIADVMMGGGGEAGDGLSELQTGAVAEAMSQMMNAAGTSLSSVIHQSVEVSNPDIQPYSPDVVKESLPRLNEEPFTVVRFNITLGEGREMPFVQYLAASQAKGQVDQLMALQPEESAARSGETTVRKEEMEEQLVGAAAAQSAGQSGAMAAVDPVTVRPVEFASFDSQQQVFGEENKNLNLVMDVSLSLTVELGKTTIPIKEVLELTRGSVIELDRVAGEPVDLLANGKLIAKGEVVVIEDNFGLRITSIVSPADRLRGM